MPTNSGDIADGFPDPERDQETPFGIQPPRDGSKIAPDPHAPQRERLEGEKAQAEADIEFFKQKLEQALNRQETAMTTAKAEAFGTLTMTGVKDAAYHGYTDAMSIWVTFQKEGIHKYPEAATDPRLADVSFLAFPHRHTFHFRVEMTVGHDNRDVEFILLKRELESLYEGGTLQLNHKSCEMLARELADYMSEHYPANKIVVSVSEDLENGATIVRTVV